MDEKKETEIVRKLMEKISPALIIGILAVLPFAYPLFSGRVINAGDIRFQYLPNFLEVRNQLLTGQIPLWNPNTFLGWPLVGVSGVGIFHPISQFLFRLPDPYTAFQLDFPIHFFIAGLSMYLYARVLKLSRGPALAAALIFMLSASTFHRIVHPSLLRPLVLIPAILLFVELGVQRSFFFFVAAGAVTGLQILGAHYQMPAYTALAVGVYGLWRAAERAWKQRNFRPLGVGLTGLIVVYVIGAGLAAVQIVPTWELTTYSARASRVSFSVFSSYAFDPRNAFQLVMPLFYGEPAAGTFWASRWDYASIYVGILPLLLTPFAFFGKRRRLAIFLGLMAAMALLLALGSKTPLLRLLYYIPLINRFRAPARFLHFYVLAVSILAGLGLEGLRQYGENKTLRNVQRALWAATGIGLALTIVLSLVQSRLNRWLQAVVADMYAGGSPYGLNLSFDNPERQAYHLKQLQYAPETILISVALLALLLGLAAVLFSLRQRLGPGRFSLAAVGLIAVELMFFGLRIAPLNTMPRSFFQDRPASVAQLPQGSDPYRILSWDTRVFELGRSPFSREVFKIGEERIIYDGQGVPEEYFFREREILPPNGGLVFGVQTFNVYSPLKPTQWNDITQLLNDGQGPNQIGNRHLLDLLNIRYVLSSGPLTDPQLRLIDNGEVLVYENTSVLPRAFLVSNWRTVADDATAMAELRSKDFDPATEAVVVGVLPEADATGATTSGRVKHLDSYPGGGQTFEVETFQATLLVVSNWFYPGWEARVNGQPAPIVKVDYLLQGVYLEPGHYTVDLAYRPQSVRLGASLSALTVVIILIAGLFGWWRSDRRHRALGPDKEHEQ